ALQAAAALVQRLGLSGFYVGMPTKATSRQVRDDIDTMLQRQGSPLRANIVYSGATTERNPTAPRFEMSEIGADETAEASDGESTGSTQESSAERGTNEV